VELDHQELQGNTSAHCWQTQVFLAQRRQTAVPDAEHDHQIVVDDFGAAKAQTHVHHGGSLRVPGDHLDGLQMGVLQADAGVALA